ncbi:hypothetical protein D3C76_1700690 [compost metagenome]
MVEVEKQPFVLQQPQDEIQITLAILSDITVRLERSTQVEFEAGQCFIVSKYTTNNGFDRLLLEYSTILTPREHP